jgi:hypothetical protein
MRGASLSVLFVTYYWGGEVKENKMGRTCSTAEELRNGSLARKP